VTDIPPFQIHELKNIAKRAGDIIMEIYRRPYQVSSKEDASPLTEADLASDRYIREALSFFFPSIPILSEESALNLPKVAHTFFLVDPLDGTKEFIAKNGEFTVNIALISDSSPVAAVVYAPAIDELFFAIKGEGAWKEKNATSNQVYIKKLAQLDALTIISSRSHQSGELKEFLRTFSVPFSLIEAGSSLKFCRIAEGAADLYPRFGPTSQWDTAAGQCILEAAGGMVVKKNGEALNYGLEKPILNGHFIALGDPRLKGIALNDIS